MGKNKIFWIIIFLATLGKHLLAFEEIYFLGENQEIVTLTRTPLPLWATPSRTEIIKQSSLVEEGALNLADILSTLSPFQIKWEPDNSHFYFRGLKDGMLLMIDGIPIYEIESPLSYEIPLSPVKQVEIIYGPFTSIWGFNAPAGVINLKTRDGQLFSTEKIYYSSYGRVGNIFSTGINRKNLQIVTSLEVNYGKEINSLRWNYPVTIKPGGNLLSPGEILSTRKFSPEDSNDYFASLFIKGSTPFISGEILISDSNRNFNISPFSSMPVIKPGYVEKPFTIFILDKNFQVEGVQITSKFFFKKVKLKSYEPLFRKTKFTPFNGAIMKKENSRSEGLDINAVVPLGGAANLNFGLIESYQSKNIFTSGTGILTGREFKIFTQAEKIWTHSIYAQFSTIWQNSALMGGLRIHKQGVYPVVLSPFASVIFKCKNFIFKTMGGISYNTPEKIDKTLLGISLIKQQVRRIIDLVGKPEKIVTLSEDILFKNENNSVGLSIYYNQYIDRITNRVERGDFLIINSPTEKWWGITLNGRRKIKNHLEISLSVDYSSRREIEVSPFKIQGEIKLEYNNLLFKLDLQKFLSSKLYITRSWLGKIVATGKITSTLLHQLVVTNLFNSNYRDQISQDLPPRSREIKWIIMYKW